jgi:hypothetical protein
LGIVEGCHEGCHTLNFGTLRRILALFDECLALFEEFQILKAGTLRGTLRAPAHSFMENYRPRRQKSIRALPQSGPPSREAAQGRGRIQTAARRALRAYGGTATTAQVAERAYARSASASWRSRFEPGPCCQQAGDGCEALN